MFTIVYYHSHIYACTLSAFPVGDTQMVLSIRFPYGNMGCLLTPYGHSEYLYGILYLPLRIAGTYMSV